MAFKHFPAVFVAFFLLWLIWLLLPLLVEALFLWFPTSSSGSVGYGSSPDSRRVFGANNCKAIIILEYLRAFAYEFQNFIFGYTIYLEQPEVNCLEVKLKLGSSENSTKLSS